MRHTVNSNADVPRRMGCFVFRFFVFDVTIVFGRRSSVCPDDVMSIAIRRPFSRAANVLIENEKNSSFHGARRRSLANAAAGRQNSSVRPNWLGNISFLRSG